MNIYSRRLYRNRNGKRGSRRRP